MLDTLSTSEIADEAPPPITTDKGVEMRPLRFLVPTTRRGTYHVSPEQTLTASDLGITRRTTDRQLTRIADRQDHHHTLASLWAIRDGLRRPRDITEAREWGFVVPVTEHENREELETKGYLRLGWWWVYDPEHYETEQQRFYRYMADERPITVKGLARVACRALFTCRDIHNDTITARGVIADTPGVRDTALKRFLNENPGYDGTVDQARALVLQNAREFVLKGTPEPVDAADEKDMFTVADVLTWANKTRKLNQWYEWTKGTQTGRPAGSRTRRWKPRRAKATPDTGQ